MTSAAHINADITNTHGVILTESQRWKHSHEAHNEQDGGDAIVAGSAPPLSQFHILST